jgi:hypothetical protein
MDPISRSFPTWPSKKALWKRFEMMVLLVDVSAARMFKRRCSRDLCVSPVEVSVKLVCVSPIVE